MVSSVKGRSAAYVVLIDLHVRSSTDHHNTAQNGDEGYQPVAHQVRRPLGQCNWGNNYYGGRETGLHGLVEGMTTPFARLPQN